MPTISSSEFEKTSATSSLSFANAFHQAPSHSSVENMVRIADPCKILSHAGRIASSSSHVLTVFTCKRIKSRPRQSCRKNLRQQGLRQRFTHYPPRLRRHG